MVRVIQLHPLFLLTFFFINPQNTFRCERSKSSEKKLNSLLKQHNINQLMIARTIYQRFVDYESYTTIHHNRLYYVVKQNIREHSGRAVFEWKADFVEKLHLKSDFTYLPFCFFDENVGYLVLIEKYPTQHISRIAFKMNIDQQKQYVINIIKLFRIYEELNVVYLDFSHEELRNFLNNISRPVFFLLDNLYRANSLAYLPTYSAFSKINSPMALPRLTTSSNIVENTIIKSNWNEDFVELRASRSWNVLTVLKSLSTFAQDAFLSSFHKHIEEHIYRVKTEIKEGIDSSWEEVESLIEHITENHNDLSSQVNALERNYRSRSRSPQPRSPNHLQPDSWSDKSSTSFYS